ncbi:alpha/beta fold hydrolase [Kutzneria kofuensis]|uniref:Pimeloyl-ACP methyl ester carboxylesterase n=1 Tax=Kutzneria kofuensis TaxID=103725 RepID=A0A7W9KI68_9PSEU|nr:alpha/beta hydrolase [Kutzneria kofuensis]MBB5893053.1 pimeloyl-ACP methyl ester carboxylesterase [Kutzneria kofuensis]
MTAADGTELACYVSGPADAPPVVLIHGWSAAASSWGDVGAGRLRTFAVDLRGHGDSDRPAAGYHDAETWAGDVAAVLDVVGAPAVLVGWSYGGLVITDYLRRHGTAGVAGIVLVGAITEIGRGHPGGRVGPAMRAALPAALSEDADVAVPALLELTRHMTGTPLTGAALQAGLSVPLSVPPHVRAAMFQRDVDNAELLRSIDVPTLLVHGTADAVVDPRATEYAAGLIPGARTRWYEGIGHMPFVECVEDFTADLVTFAQSVMTTKAGS